MYSVPYGLKIGLLFTNSLYILFFLSLIYFSRLAKIFTNQIFASFFFHSTTFNCYYLFIFSTHIIKHFKNLISFMYFANYSFFFSEFSENLFHSTASSRLFWQSSYAHVILGTKFFKGFPSSKH